MEIEPAVYYRLKQELGAHIDEAINARVEKERSLFGTYIGAGLKVVAAGLSICAVALGFLGWKSINDIDNAIKKAINDRLDSANPVVRYEYLLKNSAIDGILAALASAPREEFGRRQCFGSELTPNPQVVFLMSMLSDSHVSDKAKLKVLTFLFPRACENLITEISNTIKPLIDAKYSDPQDQVAIAEQILMFFRASKPSMFIPEVLRILQKNPGNQVISRLSAEYLLTVTQDEGAGLYQILSRYNDPAIQIVLLFARSRAQPKLAPDDALLHYAHNRIQQSPEYIVSREGGDISLAKLLYYLSVTSPDTIVFDRFFREMTNAISSEDPKVVLTKEDLWGGGHLRDWQVEVQMNRSERFKSIMRENLGQYRDFLGRVAEYFLLKIIPSGKVNKDELQSFGIWWPMTEAPPEQILSEYPAVYIESAPFHGVLVGDDKKSIDTATMKGNLIFVVRKTKGAYRLSLFESNRNELGVPSNQLPIIESIVELTNFETRDGLYLRIPGTDRVKVVPH